MSRSRKSRIENEKTWSYQSAHNSALRCDMRNSMKNQNRNKENKQCTRYKQCM